MTKRLSRLRFILWSLLVLGLVSCGEGGLFGPNTPTPNLVVSTPTTISLPPGLSAPARIRAQGYVRVGVRYDDDPFGNVDDQGDLVGFDVDLAREFASRWLGDAQAVRFVQVTNASVGDRVRTGQVDLVIGALRRHQTTALDVDFSAPYYDDGLSLLVRSGPAVTNTVGIAGPGDLNGVAVGVVEGDDTEAPLLRATGQALPQVVYYPDYFSTMAGLETRVVDAVVGPRRTLERLAAGSSSLGLTPAFVRNSYAVGVPKNEGPYLDLVNVTLMNVINDGTFGRLFAQWFPDEAPPELEIWTGTSRLNFAGMSDALAPAPATIQQIEARGYLAVGILDDQLPFGDFDANGAVRGFEADLARLLASRWLGDRTAVQFVRHSEESGIAALQSGQIDLLAARLPHTLPRDDEIDFTQTIYQGGTGFLVAAASGVGEIGGLNGGAVAVPNDGVTGDVVQRAAAQAGIAVSVQAVSDANAALAGVAEGRYRAYAGWRGELLNLAYTNSGFVVLDERLTDRPIALGLRQNDGAFRDLVNLTLQSAAVDGRFAAVYAGWFGTDPPFPVEVWPGAPFRSLELNPAAVAVPTAAP